MKTPAIRPATGNPTPSGPAEMRLTAAEFRRLSDVPPEAEWFANLKGAQTRRAYENDIRDFMAFVGITRPDEFRLITRAHVIAWRDALRPQPGDARKRLASST